MRKSSRCIFRSLHHTSLSFPINLNGTNISPHQKPHQHHQYAFIRFATSLSPDPTIPIQGSPLLSPSRPTPPPPIGPPTVSECRLRSAIIPHQTVTDSKTPSNLPQLSLEQRALVDIMHQEKNVYFTGRAGTGKSHVLRVFIREAREIYNRKVAVMAPTGIAASHIGGQTIHSYFSLWASLICNPDRLYAFIRQSPWRVCKYDTDVIMLDEASMLSPQLFDVLHHLMLRLRPRHKRDTSKPFAGAQIILCGDFYQLPPVVQDKRHDVALNRLIEIQKLKQLAFENTQYLFDSATWDVLMKHQMHIAELTQNFRQSDPDFIELLNDVRVGELSQKSWETLDACRRPLPIDGIIPTRLHVHRRPALEANIRNLQELPGPEIIFESIDHLPRKEGYPLPQDQAVVFQSSYHWDNFQADRILPLRIGAQVILVKNMSIEDGLVNGARGVIVGFQTHSDQKHTSTVPVQIPIVKFANGNEFAIPYDDFETELDDGIILTRTQIPLKLGWALTIHKSQGMTLDKVELSMPVAFTCGQAYVALSRAKTLSGLHIKELHPKAIVASNKVKQFYAGLNMSH